jgi:hypothetical protein
VVGVAKVIGSIRECSFDIGGDKARQHQKRTPPTRPTSCLIYSVCSLPPKIPSTRLKATNKIHEVSKVMLEAILWPPEHIRARLLRPQ